MRVVFLFFLLINVVYFYTQSDYFHDRQGPTILKPETLPRGVDRLTLLRERGLGIPASKDSGKKAIPTQSEKIETLQEVKQAKPVASTVTETQPVTEENKAASEHPKSAETVCFTLGPFIQVSTASRTAETISELGVTVNRRQTSQRRPRGYWVYLPAFKTYDAARKSVAELKKKGLKDLFIMGKGEHRNAVSLGLFKSRSAAMERFEQVKKMGLNVKMDTQYRITNLAWLDMEVPGDRTSTIAEITDIANKIPKTTLAQRRCK